MAYDHITFRVDGKNIEIPDDLSHIPSARRRKLKTALKAGYPSAGGTFFTGIVAGAWTAALFLVLGIIFFPFLLGVPVALLWGLLGALGVIDINEKSRNRAHRIVTELYRDGYLEARV